ncbi:hypothetical protein [Amycolatopsis sp. NPDC051061]|uniref:hypothetical protein n=1 Tax=Amycolatopsis sp. NPDC051061 TaxID=3155042 RepID=UPI003422FCC0
MAPTPTSKAPLPPPNDTCTPSACLGGIPTGKVRYDNLRSAVRQVLGFSRARVENERWLAFRSHFGLDTFYCQPGIKGAHEKGGVEGEIGASAATTWSRSRRWTRSPSSTP